MGLRYLLAWRNNIQPRKPFPGFHPGIYREQRLTAGSPRDALAHWHEQGQPKGPWLHPVITPQSPAVQLPAAGEVALHIHVFYPELLAAMLERLSHNQLKPDLFVSYSEPTLEPTIRRTLQQHRLEASLHPVPNRGRDIGPLLSELGLELDRRYSIHGHLHTKKSVLVDGGIAARWRDFLLMNLLGARGVPMADRITAALHTNPQLGLVYPDDPADIGWTQNRHAAEALAERLALPALPEAINFPVGTMFWARRGALSRLYELGLTWDDYPKEPLGYDGTMLHAIERLLPLICQSSGFHCAVTHVPGFTR
jgi:lipopolysaccharide biosynthesis protein